jgi:hypothetical protein
LGGCVLLVSWEDVCFLLVRRMCAVG